MKPSIHPEYDYVVFRDREADFLFQIRSTAIPTPDGQVEKFQRRYRRF